MHGDNEELIAVSLETMAGRKGLDYIIECGINSIENAHRQRVFALIETIKKMGEAVKRGDFAIAEEVYDEFRAD